MSDPLQLLLDEREIIAVALRYARALDGRDWVALTSCFLPDAEWGAPETIVRGHEAIRAKAEAALSKVDATQHLTSNFEVELAGDQATLRSYYVATHVRRGLDSSERRFVVGGTYEDEWQRTSHGWQIARRTLRGSWSDGDPAVIGTASV